MAGKDIWFRYAVVAGRFSAWPVSWQGWVSMLVIVGLPIVIADLSGMWAMRRFGPLGLVGVLLAALAVIVPSILALVRAKGEKVKP